MERSKLQPEPATPTMLESAAIAQIRATFQLDSTTTADVLPTVLDLARDARARGYVFRAPLVMAALYPGSLWGRSELVLT